jgi:hypothetical protein
MAGSQNALCVGEGLPDPETEAHPTGVAVAQRLVDDLRAAGFAFSPPDNWRDVGWFSFLKTEELSLELALSTPDQLNWFLRLVPMPPEIRPTVVKRETIARGRQVCYAVAQVAHTSLAAIFRSIRWALDADPSTSATAQPIPPT